MRKKRCSQKQKHFLPKCIFNEILFLPNTNRENGREMEERERQRETDRVKKNIRKNQANSLYGKYILLLCRG